MASVGLVIESVVGPATFLEAFRRPALIGVSFVTCFMAFRRLCRSLNRAERHCSAEALCIEAGRTAPLFGDGLHVDDRHLPAGMDAKEYIQEICALVGEVPESLSDQQVCEAVRRLLFLAHPTCPGRCIGHEGRLKEDTYWSEDDCKAIAKSLLHDADVVRSDHVSPKPLPVPPYFPPRPIPSWMEQVQLCVNGFGGALMNLLGLRPCWLNTEHFTLYYYDSGPAPPGGDQVPMVFVHGMFTSGCSMGVLAKFLSYSRRVIVLDLPDFDYSCSHVVQTAAQPCQSRPGTYAHHVEAVAVVTKELLSSGNCGGQVDLCGHSYGGGIVATASEKLGSSVRHLHLLAPARTGATKVFPPAAARMSRAMSNSSFLARHVITPIQLGIFRSPNALNMMAALGPERRRMSGQPWCCRCQVIFGSNDGLVAPRAAEKVQAFFPQGEGWMLQGSAHQLQIISAGSVCDLMESFAARNGGCGAPAFEPLFRQFLRMILHTAVPSLLFDNIK